MYFLQIQRDVESHLQTDMRLHLDLACVKLNKTEDKLRTGGGSKLRQFSWPDDPPKNDVTSGFKNRRAARSVSCKMDAREFMVSSFLWPPLTRNCLSWIPEMLQSYWIIYFSRYIGKTEMFSTVLMAFSRQLRAMSWRVCRNFQYMCGSNFCFSWLLIQCNCQFK